MWNSLNILLSVSLLLVLVCRSSSQINLPFIGNGGGNVCSVINCGEGTCQPSVLNLLGFECGCHPGWGKIQIGPFTWPFCVLPACTINFNCGKTTTTQIIPQLQNLSDPCSLMFCGDGVCSNNGNGYSCTCNPGSANLMNSPAFPCVNECIFGPDCKGLGLGKQPEVAASPPIPLAEPPVGRYGSGKSEASSNARSIGATTVIAIAGIVLGTYGL